MACVFQYNLMTVVQDFGVQQYKHVCGFIAFISLENSLGDIDATVKYDRVASLKNASTVAAGLC